MVAFQNGLKVGPLAQSLAKTTMRTFTKILRLAHKYNNTKEVMKAKNAK